MEISTTCPGLMPVETHICVSTTFIGLISAIRRRSHLSVLIFLLFSLSTLSLFAQNKDEPVIIVKWPETPLRTFPKSLECIPQPVYRHREDGKPGREILVNFVVERLRGPARVEVKTGQVEESEYLSAPDSGFSSCTVILPPGVGVREEAVVTVSMILGKNRISQTFTVQPLRQWNVYLYNHSHVDIGYTNTHKNVEILHKTNILEGIKLAEATRDYPEGARYRWNPEVTWPLERLWETMPEQREAILDAIRKNYLTVDAGYVNINTSVCSDEELFHVFRFSREMQALTGQPMTTFQQLDIPGMSWGLIPVMVNQGVKYIMSWPNYERAGNAHKEMDGKPFWWVGPDGKSKVLFFQPGPYANSGSMTKGGTTGRPWFGQRDPDKVPAVIKTGSADVNFTGKLAAMEKDGYPYDFAVLSWTLWDNCPLDADIPDAVRAWNERYAYPHIIISSGHEIMSMIEQKYGAQLPVVTGDYTEYWTDGLGTAAGLTAMNRNAKERLTQAETMWTMLHPGKPSPRGELDEAWRYIALGSEHTWCAENPSEPYFQDAIWKVKQSYFHEANSRTQTLLEESLAPVTDKSNGALGPVEGPSAGGIAVFNTQSWAHGGLVTLSPSESLRGDRVFDELGKEVPAQRLSTGELVFLSSDVPAFGSRHYRVEAGKSNTSGGCSISNLTLENSKIRVKLDPKTGNIIQLTTLYNGRNFAKSGDGGGLNFFRWMPGDSDNAQSDSVISISVSESGPVVAELRIVSKATGCRIVSRSVRIIRDQPWVETSNVVDKFPLLAKDGIHIGFDFDIPDGKTRVDIPWGVMEVEKDQWPQGNRNWLAVQRWLDVSNEKEGVTWCSLDAALFESGEMTANLTGSWGKVRKPWLDHIVPGTSVYSWVMNNHWHTNFPLTQDGPVTFRYRLLPHGAFDAAAANRFGLEQSQPLVHVTANIDPKIKPLLTLDNDRVVVTILKPSAEGKGTLVRLRSLSDKPETVNLRWDDTSRPDEKIMLDPWGMATVTVK